MTLEDRLDDFYRTEWAAKRWQAVPGYDRVRLNELATSYERFGAERGWHPALSASLRGYAKTVVKPWVGSSYASSRFKIVVLLREYPLPAVVEGDGLTEESKGKKRIGPNIMRSEIQELRKAPGLGSSAYTTLRRACQRAHEVARAERPSAVPERLRSDWLDRIVVTDLVKPFAIFRGEARCGVPFDPCMERARLSRMSVHNRHMYRWALERLERELDLLEPDLVVSLVGNAGWRCADSPRKYLDGILKKFKIQFLQHPGARSAQELTPRGNPGWRR